MLTALLAFLVTFGLLMMLSRLANLDGRWIAFAKLEFRFRCPRAKHAWREVIASFFVVVGQELLDFFNTAIVDVLAHDIPLFTWSNRHRKAPKGLTLVTR